MPDVMPAKKSYSPTEVAEATEKGIATIYRHLRNGKLPAAKPGGQWLITRDDLAEYLGSEDRVDALFGREEKEDA